MLSLSRDKGAESMEAFNSKSRYLDDLLNIYAKKKVKHHFLSV